MSKGDVIQDRDLIERIDKALANKKQQQKNSIFLQEKSMKNVLFRENIEPIIQCVPQ